MAASQDAQDKEFFPHSVMISGKTDVLNYYQPLFNRHCVVCGLVVKYQVLQKVRQCPARHPVEYRDNYIHEKVVTALQSWGRCVHCDNYVAAHHRFCSTCGRKHMKFDGDKSDRLRSSLEQSVRSRIKVEMDKALSEHGLQSHTDPRRGFIISKMSQDMKGSNPSKNASSSSKFVSSLKRCVPGLKGLNSPNSPALNHSTPLSGKIHPAICDNISAAAPLCKIDTVTESDEEILACVTYDESNVVSMASSTGAESTGMSLTSSLPNVSNVSASLCLDQHEHISVNRSVEDMSWTDSSRASMPSTSLIVETTSRNLRSRQGHRRQHADDMNEKDSILSKSDEPVMKKNRKTNNKLFGRSGSKESVGKDNCVDLVESDEDINK